MRATDKLVKLKHKNKKLSEKENSIVPFKLPVFKESDFVGYRDPETGYYVLPKEWDDEY